ncbi:hypothetical protein ACI797_16720 [Geodermatophilus sp. SYSU D00691]
MTWLLVVLAWTVCAVVVAPVIGRVLAHVDAARSVPAVVPRQRAPLTHV